MPNEDDLQNFNYEEFAANLTQQAGAVIPPDVKGEGRAFIVDIIQKFCNMACEALVKEENSKLDAQKASLVVQFIGEWIFHKAIDLIRAKIEPEYREGILQKVAFTVYEIAKRALESDMPQDDLINLVESHVKKSFHKALDDLTQKGALPQEAADNALSQSNIDAMAAQQVEDEISVDMATMSDAKIIKLASLAVLMKNFSSDKMKAMLIKLSKPERDILINYLKMPDLEEKLDIKAAMKCFEEIKNTLPEAVVISYDRAYKRMYKIVKNSDKNEILDIIKDERPAIRDFVMSCYGNKKRKVPAQVADIVSKYLEEKVS